MSKLGLLPRWQGITADGRIIRSEFIEFHGGNQYLWNESGTRGCWIKVAEVVDYHVKRVIDGLI